MAVSTKEHGFLYYRRLEKNSLLYLLYWYFLQEGRDTVEDQSHDANDLILKKGNCWNWYRWVPVKMSFLRSSSSSRSRSSWCDCFGFGKWVDIMDLPKGYWLVSGPPYASRCQEEPWAKSIWNCIKGRADPTDVRTPTALSPNGIIVLSNKSDSTTWLQWHVSKLHGQTSHMEVICEQEDILMYVCSICRNRSSRTSADLKTAGRKLWPATIVRKNDTVNGWSNGKIVSQTTELQMDVGPLIKLDEEDPSVF